MKNLLILLLTICTALGARDQRFVGNWERFSSFSTPTKVIETPEYVYTLAGTSLSSIDKSTGELQALNALNRLNGNKVTGIWYDRDNKYLLVAYEDYNIDLVYDDGRTINVPDLRDAAITQDKTVNDADFAHGKAYVGLASGLIVIDADHGAIIESNIWNKNIYNVAVLDDYLVVNCRGEGSMSYAPVKGSHHDFSMFKTVPGGFNPLSGMCRLSGTMMLAANYQNLITFDFSKETPERKFINTNSVNTYAARSVIPTSKGMMFFASSNKLVYVDNDATVRISDAYPQLAGHIVADWSAATKAPWAANADGVGQYSVADNAFAVGKAKPRGPSGTNTGRLIQGSDGRILLSTAEVHQTKALYNLAMNKQTYVDLYDPASRTFSAVPQSALLTSLRSCCLNPHNPNQVIAGFRQQGVRVIDATTGKFTELNSQNTPMPPTLSDATGIAVDKDGNLWIVMNEDVLRLIKALKGSWEGEPDPSKWSVLQIKSVLPKHSTRLVLDENKGNVIVTGSSLAVVKMPGANELLTATTKYQAVDCSVDEDGASTGDPYVFSMPVVDKNGWIWAPHNQGVFVIKNSDDMFNPSYHPTRPKVPRNDGTNLADYLLSQVDCQTVAVDENNQKWIGTIGSGLYRVSAAGDEILEHITANSSQLPSDDIFAVLPSRTNNDVYVGTADGFAIYHSVSAPAASSYDDVYAYPNPVTPDYTGYITITGLMENSLVKIADAGGNPIFETRSEGGMCVWNGCDTRGHRVRSGVYFVFASQTAEGATGAAVTKIIVVN
ncbi:MAG: hypothetical protein K2N10_08060 [Muribaculaceae bacterium]|nr:hypothetical protein [Muribaculaceae bacterium]